MESRSRRSRNYACFSSEFWSLSAVRAVGNTALGFFMRAASWCSKHSPSARVLPHNIAEKLTEQLAEDVEALERAGLIVACVDGWTLRLEQHLRFRAVSE